MQFIRCEKVDQQTVPREEFEGAFGSPVQAIAGELCGAYSKAFPGMPALRFGLTIEPRNGASGYWTVSPAPDAGPFFVIEIDPALTTDQTRFDRLVAHEMAHPIIRLRGVPSAIANPPNDQRVADEFTSTIHHPHVFMMLDKAGYGDGQRADSVAAAKAELDKLCAEDLNSPNYTGVPGQLWRGLWYFNFSLLAPDEYASIRAFHAQGAPGVFERMKQVERCWKEARQSASAAQPLARTHVFRRTLWKAFGFDGYVRSQDPQEFAQWLFPWQGE